MAVAFGATIALMMSHNQENVVWSVVAFLPVPIFFLSYSPLRSAVMGPCREWFEILFEYFMVVIVIVVILLPFLLLLVIYLVFKGLGKAVIKVCLSIIRKPLCWIRGIFFHPKFSQPSEPPLTHHV